MAWKSKRRLVPLLASIAVLAGMRDARADPGEVTFACDGKGLATIFDDSVNPKLEPDAVRTSVGWRDTVSFRADDDGRHYSVQALAPVRLTCGRGDKAIDFIVTAAWDTNVREMPMEGLTMWPSVRVESQGKVLLKDVALTMCAAAPPAEPRNCAVTILGFVSSANEPRIALRRLTLDWIQ